MPHLQRLIACNAVWETVKDPNTGHTYWWNTLTDEVSWSDPSLAEPEPEPTPPTEVCTTSRCLQLNPSPQDATAALPAALRSKLAKKGIGSEEASEPAVKAPVPATTVSGASADNSKWVKVVDEKSGHPYYHNTETNEVSWTKPEECSNTEEVRWAV